MTTGTTGNDILSNDPNVYNELVFGLEGDDVITIVTPATFGSPAPSIFVNAGDGFDTLIVNTSGRFDEIAAQNGSILVRFGPGQFYNLGFFSIERLELTGTLFGNGFSFGDEIDVLRFSSSTARANISTQGGADDVALTGTFVTAFVAAGEGDDIVDFRGLTGVLESIQVQGNGGNDILYASALLDPDIFFGFDGNDALIFGANLTSQDLADGGPGTDTLVLQGNYPQLSLNTNVVDVEVLLIASGSDSRFGDLAGNSYDYSIAVSDFVTPAGGTLNVSATGLLADEDLSFFAGAVTDSAISVFTGRGTDFLAGGAAQDGFFFGADGNFTSADTVDGGGGTDSFALRGNYSGAGAAVFQAGTLANVEVIVLLSGLTNEFGGPIVPGGFDYDLILADGNIAAGRRVDIIAASLAAGESVTVDASAETDGSVRIISGAGADTLIGTANADSLYGGLGADTITGGGGADFYVYRAVTESTAAAQDALDFGTGDRIDLSFIDGDGPGGANAFAFIGAAAFSNVAGQLRAFESAPDVWTVEGDTNGDGTADLVITVNSTDPLAAGDFVL